MSAKNDEKSFVLNKNVHKRSTAAHIHKNRIWALITDFMKFIKASLKSRDLNFCKTNIHTSPEKEMEVVRVILPASQDNAI